MGSFTKSKAIIQTPGKITLDSGGNIELLNQVVVKSSTPNATGARADGGDTGAISDNPTIYVESRNYEILTTILVDIHGWHSNNSANKVIGDAASGTNAYLTSLTKAVNGYIYLAECMCMEVPAGGERNLNVILSTAALNAQASEGTHTEAVTPGGDWVLGQQVEWDDESVDVPSGSDTIGETTYYVYLATAAGGEGTGTYNAGKFLIRFYGYKTF